MKKITFCTCLLSVLCCLSSLSAMDKEIEIKNGFLGMKRDVALRLIGFLRDKAKIGTVIGVSGETFLWKNHFYFKENLDPVVLSPVMLARLDKLFDVNQFSVPWNRLEMYHAFRRLDRLLYSIAEQGGIDKAEIDRAYEQSPDRMRGTYCRNLRVLVVHCGRIQQVIKDLSAGLNRLEISKKETKHVITELRQLSTRIDMAASGELRNGSGLKTYEHPQLLPGAIISYSTEILNLVRNLVKKWKAKTR